MARDDRWTRPSGFRSIANANLIGITAVFAWNSDPTGQAAILAMSFIVPEFRGRGLSHLRESTGYGANRNLSGSLFRIV